MRLSFSAVSSTNPVTHPFKPISDANRRTGVSAGACYGFWCIPAIARWDEVSRCRCRASDADDLQRKGTGTGELHTLNRTGCTCRLVTRCVWPFRLEDGSFL